MGVMFLFLLHNWQIMSSGHVTPPCHGGLLVNGTDILFTFFEIIQCVYVTADQTREHERTHEHRTLK